MQTIDPAANGLPVLYSFRRCPYAMRARMALKYSGIAVELREILLRNKPEAMLRLSAKGTVPVMVLADGTVIDESLEVMHWALAINDPDQWWSGLNKKQAAETTALVDQNDFSFKETLDNYKYADRYPEHSAEYYRHQGEQFLELLNARLNNQDYLLGNAITFADIAIFPFIRQFAHVDKDWFYHSPYKKLQIWLDQFLQSELFNSVMQKYQPWVKGSEPVVFN